MGHMLRKTAAVAVLILVLTSFTLGSTVRVQTVAGTERGQDEAKYLLTEGGRAGLTPMAALAGARHVQTEAGGISMGFVQNMPDMSDGGPVTPPGVAFVTTVDGQVMSGIVRQDTVLSIPDESVSSIIFYMDEVRLEQPAVDGFVYTTGNRTPAGAMFALPVRMPDKPDFDNMTIKGKVAMTRPGADPEFYDFQWKKFPGGEPVDNGTLARFSGHMTLPERNGTFGKAGPFEVYYGPATAAVEINSDMMVDLANLPVTVTTERTNATYNNHIAAGDTNWHSASVGNAVKSLNVDLKWNNPGGKLRLMVYTPDGKVLGPYYDDSDGTTDGRINLNIANPSGVAAGEWHLKVTDTDTLGDNDYYLKTY
jgi:hypothetical protein